MATATRKCNAPVKLTNRGVAVAATGVAVLVAFASSGHPVIALAVALTAYALVTGRVAAVAALVPTATQALRALCWVVVAVVAVAAANDVTGPGGATLGLALAAALATALRCTRHRARRATRRSATA